MHMINLRQDSMMISSIYRIEFIDDINYVVFSYSLLKIKSSLFIYFKKLLFYINLFFF